MATIRPERLSELMQCSEKPVWYLMPRLLLKWQLLTLVLPDEAVGTMWCEIDMEKRLWIIPSERMKKRRQHHAPLSPQVMAMLTVETS